MTKKVRCNPRKSKSSNCKKIETLNFRYDTETIHFEKSKFTSVKKLLKNIALTGNIYKHYGNKSGT